MNAFALVHDESDLFQPGMMQLNKNGNNPGPASIFYQQKISKHVLRWFKCEYFYSWIDRPFFLSHDFKHILQTLELQSHRMTKLEWCFIRTTILAALNENKVNEDGTPIIPSKSPRRFSDAYIKEEREKLKAYREVFREIMK
jgi:hypothetical protein